MACVKLGSKLDTLQQQGHEWFCSTGLPNDVTVEVGDMIFHLHKFPLLSKSGLIERLIADASGEGEVCPVIVLTEIPGGVKAFELVAKFCYGMKLELTSFNVVYLRCAAEYLEMREEYGEGNLVLQTEAFFSQIVLGNWKDTLHAFQTCEGLLPYAENLNITKRCIESLSTKACTSPTLSEWPMVEHGSLQSPGGSVLWNGISTGARPRSFNSDWWYDDVSQLCLPLYKRLIATMQARGLRQEVIAGSLSYYAKKHLPGLSGRQGIVESGSLLSSRASLLSEDEQRHLLEVVDNLLPMEKEIASTKFLFSLLRTAMILRASPACVSNLEKRVGMQLDLATVEDLLMPNYSYSAETLYNVECTQRILENFLAFEQSTGEATPCSLDDRQLVSSPCLESTAKVSKLLDGYLAEVAPDINLKLSKFHLLAATIPDYARPLDDGLYRAIDIYLKAHPWLADSEKEQLCRLIDCQKLSLEACTHAAQNERLPLRMIVQVLFFEQLQLRTSIAGCFLVSDNLESSRPLRSSFLGSNDGGWSCAARENQVLKVGMDNMRLRVSELEKECSCMKQEIEKLGHTRSRWSSLSRKLKLGIRPQMCSAQEGSVSGQKVGTSKVKERHGKHKRNSSMDG